MNSRNFTLEQILEAIDGSKGSVNTIRKRLKCTWHTAKSWIEKYDEAKQARQDEIEKMCDSAEAVVYKKIEEEDDFQAAKWYLSTIGKERGYVEKKEIDNNITVQDFPEIAEKLRKIIDE